MSSTEVGGNGTPCDSREQDLDSKENDRRGFSNEGCVFGRGARDRKTDGSDISPIGLAFGSGWGTEIVCVCSCGVDEQFTDCGEDFFVRELKALESDGRHAVDGFSVAEFVL